ncbi:MAG: BON domain-containing protein [Gammaproteobacteria bacterium]|nr:BON domain-containing protein [Gammaproteobacteria bacterium]MBU1624528.1 BON domain-containing protein [Gammaproteobacteria bacterium]MBU1982372.1 BON domain-containing protein [Gammaproteobacteria bacterium]
MRSRFLLASLFALALLQGCAQTSGISASNSERRSAAAVQDDSNIEYTSRQRIADKYRSNIQVNVTCFNRFALITGQVPNDSTKQGIERIVGSISPIKGIANELHVGSSNDTGVRRSDSGVSGDVRTRFLEDKSFNRDHIKVYTEEGVVYLMGIVTRAEADAASEIAATTRGVKKVVRVFEYMN